MTAGTTEPRYFLMSSGCSCTASEMRHEDDANLGSQLLLSEGRGDTDTVHDRIDSHLALDLRTDHAGKHLTLVQRDSELLVGFEKLGVDLVEGLFGASSLSDFGAA